MSTDPKNLSRQTPYNHLNSQIQVFRETLKQHMQRNDRMRIQKSPNNSFLDQHCQNQNQSKSQKKSLAYDPFKYKKIRALYGKRVSMKNESDDEKSQSKGERLKDSQIDQEQNQNENQGDAHNFLHKLIIHPENKYKTIFDVFVLILVAYSCI